MPEKYQEGFCDTVNGRLLIWWFNRKRQQFRREQPKNIAVEKDYYSVPDEQGNLDDTLENALADVEGATWPVISKLNSGGSPTFAERMELSLFLSLLMCRTPHFDEVFRAIGEGTAKAMVEKGWMTEPPPELLQHSREKVIGAMQGMPSEVAPTIASFDWVVLHAPRGASFILTDAPLVTVPPRNFSRYRGVGIATRGAKKFVPLTATSCLFMAEPGARFTHHKAGEGTVRDVNRELAYRAFNDVFARDEALIRSMVKRCKLTDKTPRPRVVVG